VVGAGAELVRRAAVAAWDEALVRALCGGAWADAEAQLAPPAWQAPWELAARALLVDGVAWSEAERPPEVVVPRAQAALSDLLRDRWPWGGGRALPPNLPDRVLGFVVEALLTAGCGDDDVDPPLPPEAVERAFREAMDAWRARPPPGLPAPFAALILPDSAREAVDAALRAPEPGADRAALYAAALGEAGRWSPEELLQLARLWSGPPGALPAQGEVSALLALCGKAADRPRGARLARLLALEQAGRVRPWGGR
jgi:hypothetical protein